MSSKPKFQNLWDAYPSYKKFPNMGKLYHYLGGVAERNLTYEPDENVKPKAFDKIRGNTCASRLSVACNDGGWPLDSGYILANPKLRSLGTDRCTPSIGSPSLTSFRCSPDFVGQHQRIIYRVQHFKKYLIRKLGMPKPGDDYKSDDCKKHYGRKGIVFFEVEGWNDAAGHITLFNVNTYAHGKDHIYEKYSNNGAKTVGSMFWELT